MKETTTKQRKSFDKALKIAKKNDQEHEFNIEEFASLYMKQGKYHKVDALLQESLDQKTKRYGSSHQSLISTHKLLGELNLINGNYTQSEKQFQKAKDISENILGRKSVTYAEVEEAHAKLFEAIGDYENAEYTYLDILKIKEEVLGRNHVSLARTLNSLALVQNLNGKDSDKVEKDFDEALKIVSDNIGNNNPTYAEILMDKASFYIEINRLDEADSLLKIAR